MATSNRKDTFRFEIITPKTEIPKQFYSLNKTRERFSSWSESATKDRLMISAFVGWILPLATVVIFTALAQTNLPLEIPLFYSRPWGELQVARNQLIYLPLGGALTIGLINFGLATSLHSRDKIAAYILVGIASLVAILAAITTFRIVNLMS